MVIFSSIIWDDPKFITDFDYLRLKPHCIMMNTNDEMMGCFFNRCVGQIQTNTTTGFKKLIIKKKKCKQWLGLSIFYRNMGWNMVSMVKCIPSWFCQDCHIQYSLTTMWFSKCCLQQSLDLAPWQHTDIHKERLSITMLEMHFVWHNWTNRSSFQLLTPPANSLQATSKRKNKTQKQKKTLLQTLCSTSQKTHTY